MVKTVNYYDRVRPIPVLARSLSLNSLVSHSQGHSDVDDDDDEEPSENIDFRGIPKKKQQGDNPDTDVQSDSE